MHRILLWPIALLYGILLSAPSVVTGDIRTLSSVRQVDGNPYLYTLDYDSPYDLDDLLDKDADEYVELVNYAPYRERMDRNLRKIEKDELGGMAPEVIGKAVCKQLKKKHMAVRVIPRIDYGAVGFLVRILPERTKLWLLDLLYS